MEDEKQNQATGDFLSAKLIKKDYLLPVSVLISAIIIAGAWIYTGGLKVSDTSQKAGVFSNLEEKVLPSDGIIMPGRWSDLGAKMVSAGVIDGEKFESIYASRGGLADKEKRLLYGTGNGNLIMTLENSGVILNLLWALGLGTKNEILETGPMVDSRYGGAENFASTGSWTLSKGGAMDHYAGHSFIVLTKEQQELVKQVSQNIYRPCC